MKIGCRHLLQIVFQGPNHVSRHRGPFKNFIQCTGLGFKGPNEMEVLSLDGQVTALLVYRFPWDPAIVFCVSHGQQPASVASVDGIYMNCLITETTSAPTSWSTYNTCFVSRPGIFADSFRRLKSYLVEIRLFGCRDGVHSSVFSLLSELGTTLLDCPTSFGKVTVMLILTWMLFVLTLLKRKDGIAREAHIWPRHGREFRQADERS